MPSRISFIVLPNAKPILLSVKAFAAHVKLLPVQLQYNDEKNGQCRADLNEYFILPQRTGSQACPYALTDMLTIAALSLPGHRNKARWHQHSMVSVYYTYD